jgi:predicted amidophosphoribosyltransferase
MSSSLALDLNFEDNTSGQKTRIGTLEEKAKHHRDRDAIVELACLSVDTISAISFLSSCEFVLGVPAMPDKEFDVPRSLAECISGMTGKPDLTGEIYLKGKEKSAKAVELSEKWDFWEKCSFDYSGPDLIGKRIIVIDDKYQSGVTVQFWASKLIELGAKEVHGLSIVKTLRDTDNV